MSKQYRLPAASDFSSALWALYYKLHDDLQQLSLGQKDHPADLQMLFAARKASKRMRALLRCMRGVLTVKQLAQLHAFYRALSACIAPLRDAYVLERLLKSLPPNLFDEQHQKSLQKTLTAAYDQQAVKQAARQLKALWQTYQSPQARSKNVEAHAQFWLDLWQKALADWQKAVKKRQVHYWHEARRSAKYVYFSLGFIGHKIPRQLTLLHRQLGDFGELLGNMHDIDVKMSWLKGHCSPQQLKSISSGLLALRRGYETQAERMGHGIFNAPYAQWIAQAF